MQRKERPNEVLLGLAIALIIIASVAGLIFLKEFIGWFYHTASAGTITGVVIHQTYVADAWHGFAGTAVLDHSNNQTNWNETVSGGNTTIKDLNFNCFGRSGYDLYISPVPLEQIDFLTVQNASVADIDAFIGIDPSDRISATNTFNESFTISFGSINITAPGMRTKALGDSHIFHEVALKDGNGTIFFAANASKATLGFDGLIHNYQVMVPVPYNRSAITYYFFPDPITDVLGECEEWSYALLEGYVYDRSTGNPLENVTVQVGDGTALTNSSGWYHMLAQTGT
ncbi:hypothetical protein KY363_07710, partial [Candidatus Woesearchaeota archaeon]|nr:hypothetical protein [Candidatus Woesearchaeota archaeon]